MSGTSSRTSGGQRTDGSRARIQARRRPPRAEMCVALLCAVLLFCLGPVPPAAALDPPEIETVFRVSSGAFVVGLGSERERVEVTVAEWMAQRGDELYGFLRWRSEDSEAVGDHALILSLVQNDQTLCAPAFDLVFSARVGGTEVGLPAVPHLDLGTLCSDPAMPTTDADGAIQLAITTVDQALRDTDLREILEDQPLGHIPLADHVSVEDSSVFLPFSLADLRASSLTRLKAEFESADADEVVRPGEVELRATFSGSDNIRCEVLNLLYPGFQMGDSFDHILGDEQRRKLDLFMLDYDAALIATDTTVSDVRTSL